MLLCILSVNSFNHLLIQYNTVEYCIKTKIILTVNSSSFLTACLYFVMTVKSLVGTLSKIKLVCPYRAFSLTKTNVGFCQL